VILEDEQATVAFGNELAPLVKPGDVITLAGPLGVGKTALARAMLAAMGHEGEVPSPTFAIVQPYEQLEPPVWHVDLDRIEHPSEIAELGLEADPRPVLDV
jgi:tRNA threonylcarbamoyladenosine biosynthesis protein TsaE